MSTPWLTERFQGPLLDPRLKWMNPPPVWSLASGSTGLRVEPAGQTDFWRTTHYGFEADNGHFLFAEVSGDCVVTTQVRFHAVHQYDQAGLMVRVSPTCWLKTSVEYEPDGANRLGVVVTNHAYSDWSTQEFPRERQELMLRFRREGDDGIVEYADAVPGTAWSQIRMAHLHECPGASALACGLYACSPKGAGFVAEFRFLSIECGRVGAVPSRAVV